MNSNDQVALTATHKGYIIKRLIDDSIKVETIGGQDVAPVNLY